MSPLSDPIQPDPVAWAEVQVRTHKVWLDEVAEDWLRSPNGFLEGARPIDVCARGRSNEVFDALDQILAGSYA